MMHKCKLVFLFMFCLFAKFSYADFSSAMVDYQSQKYLGAMAEFKRLSLLGHKDSQFNVGVMYYRGEGVDKNNVEAYAWMALSAELGDQAHARMRDAVQKKMTEKEKASSLSRTEELLKQFGDAAIQKKLSPVLVSDENCKFSQKVLQRPKFEYPKKALNQGIEGSVDISYDIDENGFARNYSIVAATSELFSESILKGMSGFRYEPYIVSGKTVPVIEKRMQLRFNILDASLNIKKLKEYMNSLHEKAESGDAHDKYVYAYMMDLVPEIKYQRREINEWMYTAAQMGLPPAQYKIGRSLLYGEGCEADNSKAIEWLMLSAKASSPEAQYFLGANLLAGTTFEKNKKQGVEWLNHAAKGQYKKAIMKLAWIYSTDVDAELYNPKYGLDLINSVYENYSDRLTAVETLAAAQAANQLFDDAIKTQQEAMSIAKKINNMPLAALEERLIAYQNHQAWRE